MTTTGPSHGNSREATNAEAEKRNRYRLNARFALIGYGRSCLVDGCSMDISKRGMAGLIESDLLPGDPVTIQLELPTSGERLLLPAQVLHRNGSRYGFKFIALSMRQIESLQQLCQTLEKVKIQPASAPGTPHKCARALLLEKAIEDRTQHLEVLRSVLKHTNGSSQEYWQSEIDKLETEIRVTAELLQQQYEMDEGSSKGGKNPV